MKDFLRSLCFALQGLGKLIKTQKNARIHLVFAVGVCLLGIWFKVSRLEWILLVISIGTVLTAECLNTALEKMVDFVSPHWNDQAGQIKDLGAAAVLLAACTAAIAGGLVFISKLWP